jgi:Heparinase II/III-like protein/Heparinase II/III N-terminus
MSQMARVQWLARRVSRIGPTEVPFRVRAVVRSVCQSRGFGDASRVPARAADARFGASWVARDGVPAGIDRAAILARADALVAGRLSVFDRDIDFGDGSPRWNDDPVTGVTIDPTFGLFIDFRRVGAGIDIKYLWEVNRLSWWVPVAQAYSCTGDRRYLDAIGRWLQSWLDACPYPFGANWTSPVEHGIRVVNWSLVWHLIGGHDSALFEGQAGERLRADWLDSVYRHIRFAADNYSLHSSSDNHLIGELAGVFVGARTWDLWEPTRALGAEAARLLEREAQRQFAPDGIDLEQAFAYQRFSLEFLLASGLCARATGQDFSDATWQRIETAIVSLAALMDCRGTMPAVGDSDDAVVFELAHGKGADPAWAMLGLGAQLFGRPELADKLARLPVSTSDDVARWLLSAKAEAGAKASCRLARESSANAPVAALPTRFDRGGYLIAGDRLHEADEIRLLFDVGPLGYNRIGGHAHADALSLLLSWRGVPFLVDAGTYCYNAAPEWRRYFRGTSAHNTLEIDGTEQSIYGGSFLWLRDYSTTLESHDDDGSVISFQARTDGYRRLAQAAEHRRRVVFDRGARSITVTDSLIGAEPHPVALHWHFAADCDLRVHGEGYLATAEGSRIDMRVDAPGFAQDLVCGQESPPQGWVSGRFYEKRAAPVVRCSGVLAPDQTLVTTITLLD